MVFLINFNTYIIILNPTDSPVVFNWVKPLFKYTLTSSLKDHVYSVFWAPRFLWTFKTIKQNASQSWARGTTYVCYIQIDIQIYIQIHIPHKEYSRGLMIRKPPKLPTGVSMHRGGFCYVPLHFKRCTIQSPQMRKKKKKKLILF